MDLVYIAIAALFCAGIWGLALGCARLQAMGGRS